MSNIILLFGFLPNNYLIFYIILQKSPAGRAFFGAHAMRNSRELHRHSTKFAKKCTVTVQKSLKIALSQCNFDHRIGKCAFKTQYEQNRGDAQYQPE